MAKNNLNGFNESARQHGISGYQLIMGGAKNGKNVAGMLLEGYTFDTLTNYTREDIDMLMDNIKCMGVAEAYKEHIQGRNSKAKQKVSDANGRTDMERLVNLLDQSMTYADGVKHMIPLGSADLLTCMQCLVDIVEDSKNIMGENLNEVHTWVERMKDWHSFNAKQKVFEMLTNRDIITLNGFVYTNYALVSLVKAWAKAQNKKVSPEQAQGFVNKWVDRMQEVVGA